MKIKINQINLCLHKIFQFQEDRSSGNKGSVKEQ